MRNQRRAEARYRLAISTALIENRHTVFEAIVAHSHGCVKHQLVMFMLAEARWDEDEFMHSYIAGELDEA